MTLVIMTSILFLIIVNSIISNTEDLYAHPYTVSNLTLEIESDVRHLYSMTEELTETSDSVLQGQIIGEIEILEQEVEMDIDRIRELYLGDIQDVEDFNDAFLASNNYRDIAIALTLDGQYDDAFDYRLTTIKDNTKTMVQLITVVEDFANNKAIELTNQANRLYKINFIVVLSSVSLLIILSMALFYLLVKDISPEIEKIQKVIKTQGDQLDILDLDRKDEIGYINRNLSNMINNIKTQEEIKELNMKLHNLRDKENLRVTLMSIGDGVITTDINGIITNINTAASNLTGYPLIEAIGKNIGDVFNIVNKFTRKKVANPVKAVIKEGRIVGLANHTVLISKNGEEFDISDSGAPIMDDNADLIGVVLVFHDVTEEYENRRKINYLRTIDSLTGLYNRNHLSNTLSELKLTDHLNQGIILFDIDNLKLLNSNYDVSVGNKALEAAANILRRHEIESDMLFRYGGDEFVVLSKNRDEISLRSLAREISLDFSSETIKGISMTMSFGVKMIDEDTKDFNKIMIEVEKDLFRYKSVHMNSSQFSVLKTVLTFLTEKFSYEKSHSEFVGVMSEKLGEKLLLNKTINDELSIAGMFHDIGKITIPDEILTKPGQLTDQEFDVIKQHPVVGYRIIKEAIPYSSICDYILHHHERYDGKGYPTGLKNVDIPLQSRILCVVDAYEAMTSERVYKKRMSKNEAIKELQRCMGTQFDPVVTEAFIDIISNEKEDEEYGKIIYRN